jgi:predicted kinase
MVDASSSPLLIIVNGRPATGKTSIAERLSTELGIPLFTKDAVKELLGEVVGAPDRGAAKALGEASIALIFQHAETVLATGSPAIIECPLIPELTVEPL